MTEKLKELEGEHDHEKMKPVEKERKKKQIKKRTWRGAAKQVNLRRRRDQEPKKGAGNEEELKKGAGESKKEGAQEEA